MKPWFLKNTFTDEKDRQLARILSALIWVLGSTYLLVIVVGLISHDSKLLISA